MFALALLFLAQPEEPKPAVTIARKTATHSSEYSWSAEAKAIIALDRTLRAMAAKDGKEIAGEAADAALEAKKSGGFFPDTGYLSNWTYATAGQSPALLSLSGEWYSYSGGAHGIFGASAILWDRKAAREIQLADLFQKVTELALLHPAMCASLNAERKAKRESDAPVDTSFDTIDEAFNGCPRMDEVTGWVADTDKDALFDTVMFAADPYVAGPYVEGMYEMKVPVTARLIDALKPGYRGSFEEGRPSAPSR